MNISIKLYEWDENAFELNLIPPYSKQLKGYLTLLLANGTSNIHFMLTEINQDISRRR